MSSIFEYKPQLEYILQDINSIDNIKDARIESMKSYVVNTVTSPLQMIEEIKQLLDTVRVNVDKALEKTAVPFRGELDNVLKEKVSGFKDSSRLIEDGIITYQLYKEIKDNPILVPIIDSWEEYNCGMDGKVEAEVMPYVDIVDDIVSNIAEFIEKAVLYDEDPQARADTKKLKENELLQIEKYIYLQDELEKATRKADAVTYISIKKQLDLLENKLKYRKNINIIMTSILSRLIDIIHNINDGTITEFQTIQYNILKEQLNVISSNLGISKLAIRALTYSSFVGQYTDVLNLQRNYKNVINKGARSNTFNTTITRARLYRDVAVPSTVELEFADNSLQMRGVGNAIVSGIERMSNLYQSSILSTKNLLESEVGIVNNLINNIYEKYKTRTIYNLMEK